MKKPCRKCAHRVNSRPLFNFDKQPKTGIICKEFFYKSDISKENYQKTLKTLTLFFFRTACHPYVIRMSFVCHPYAIRVLLVCTRMSFVCHSYVHVCTRMSSVCHSYVTRMYSYVIRMSLVCTRMSSVCHSYVLVCHSHVICLWFYHEPLKHLY